MDTRIREYISDFLLSNDIPQIYGAVTSGTGWMFGVLTGKDLVVNLQEYAISEPERICGILIAMVRQTA